jgi:3-dehydroquinate dehydratase-2
VKILILNGPNLNMLGIREPSTYGTKTYADLISLLKVWANELKLDVEIHQSNHEGELIDLIQKAYFEKFDGIIINPGAFTHTSIALLDALTSVQIRTIEVHITDINAREEFRKSSYISEYCYKRIIGKGIEGYKIALEEIKK